MKSEGHNVLLGPLNMTREVVSKPSNALHVHNLTLSLPLGGYISTNNIDTNEQKVPEMLCKYV